jgi:hypothetical protein
MSGLIPSDVVLPFADRHRQNQFRLGGTPGGTPTGVKACEHALSNCKRPEVLSNVVF